MKKILSIGLPGWILVGAVTGVGAGLFFGQRAAVFEPMGKAYVMLLEAVVYPYIICSLLYGLGSLTPTMAKKLLKRSWPFYLIAWGGALGSAWLLSLALPNVPDPLALDGARETASASGLLKIILPSNIFEDLSTNRVPAVVVLSILFGAALQHSSGKEGLMTILDLVRKAGVRIWGWVVYLAPPAVFAMFAETAGSIRPDALENMLLYLGLFMAGSFLLAFWILPGMIAALAPTSYREIMKDLRAAFVLSLVTTLSVAALPFIQQAASKMARASGVEDESRDEIVGACLAVNYPLGQLGNFFVYFFMLYAAVNFGASLDLFKSLALPFMTLLSCVGSPSSTVNAVDFLASWLGLPDGTLPLYIETMVVTRYGQVALSVMGFSFLTILITQRYFGKMRVRPMLFFGHCLLSLAVLASMTVIGLWIAPRDQPLAAGDYASFELSPLTTAGVSAAVFPEDKGGPAPPPARPGESVFDRVLRTGILRVGCNTGTTPFCYLNAKGNLVGYDVACAYDLARSLGVKLEFRRFEIKGLHEELRDGEIDIVMSGIFITPERLRWAEVSSPYLQSPLALIVPSDQAKKFLHMDEIREMDDLRIATFDDPILKRLVRAHFPFARHVVVPSYDELPKARDVDAALWSFCQARSYAALTPDYTAVAPGGLRAVTVFGYYLPPDSLQMQRYLEHWIELRRRDGVLERLERYWIEGIPPRDDSPRWSIMSNVLHWGKTPRPSREPAQDIED